MTTVGFKSQYHNIGLMLYQRVYYTYISGRTYVAIIIILINAVCRNSAGLAEKTFTVLTNTFFLSHWLFSTRIECFFIMNV